MVAVMARRAIPVAKVSVVRVVSVVPMVFVVRVVFVVPIALSMAVLPPVAIVLHPPDAFTRVIQRPFQGPALVPGVAPVGAEAPLESADSRLISAEPRDLVAIQIAGLPTLPDARTLARLPPVDGVLELAGVCMLLSGSVALRVRAVTTTLVACVRARRHAQRERRDSRKCDCEMFHGCFSWLNVP